MKLFHGYFSNRANKKGFQPMETDGFNLVQNLMDI